MFLKELDYGVMKKPALSWPSFCYTTRPIFINILTVKLFYLHYLIRIDHLFTPDIYSFSYDHIRPASYVTAND